MASRVREQSGIGLVELLIAMTVLSVAIFALVAGLTSGAESTKRASKASTAATLADKRMEAYRRGTYASIATIAGATQVGPDGLTYFLASTSALGCVFGTYNALATPQCPNGANGLKNRPLKVVTVTVYDGNDAADPLLIKQTSTFDESTGS